MATFFTSHTYHMCNFRFLHICHVETSEIFPHVEKFSISPQLSYMEILNFSTWQFFLLSFSISDKYEVCFRNCENFPDKSFTCLCLHDQEWLKYEKQIHLSISVTTVLSWMPMTRLKSSLVLSIDRTPFSSKKQCEAVTAQLSLIWKTHLKNWT